jgi:glucose/arabinose dehydrogenase
MPLPLLTRFRPIAAAFAIALLVVLCSIAARPLRAEAGQPIGSADGGVALAQIGEFESPVYVDNAPGYKRLLFVVEQPGTIRVLRNGKPLGRPFLDISDQVVFQGEEGMFSVAFPPDYRKSRRFYVFYTNPDLVIDEFKRRRGSPTQANPISQRNVLTIPHRDFGNHNGGQLQFGPDGKLWLGTGDGGGGGDTLDNARNVNSLLGKLLRIDPTSKKGPYGIPPDNPFVGRDGADEIYAYGLRNPWRFSFDSATGDLAIGDVGQNEVEEVDFLTRAAARGANFGWPQFEGNQPFDLSRPGPDPPTAPIFTYSSGSGSGNCSVTGGYVVRDGSLPTLFGRYVYADLCAGQLRSFVPAPSGATDDKPLGPGVGTPTSFGEDNAGHIYVTSLDGPVYRLVAG